MNNLKMRKILFAVFLSCFAFFLSVAQTSVKTVIDKNEILIGQQFNLKIQATFSGDDFFIKWINLPDSLQHFEVVQKSKIDSTFANQRLVGIAQTFTLTSFDSGIWKLPSFNIIFNGVNNDSTTTFYTDSLPITISYSVADTSQTLKDIKAIRQVEVINPLWYWAAGLVLLLLLIWLSIWLYRRYKKAKPLATALSNVSPYEEALEALKKLSSYNLSAPKEVQQYHIKLIEIFRRYLSRKENIDYLNKTTSDILIAINDKYNAKDILTKVSTALRFSDAVKFAKYVPAENDSVNNKQVIKDIIDTIELPATNNKL